MGTPRQTVDLRAVREPGRRMRSQLLDAAVLLFREKGLAGAAVAEIAAAAGAFPSQVTYYFRTKEALFVEAACREILYAARQMEAAAAGAPTADRYTQALVTSIVAAPGLVLFIDALAVTRRRQDLAPLVERTFERLYTEGDRAYAAVRARRGWRGRVDPAVQARRFWTLALGVGLRGAAAGLTAEACAAEMLTLLNRDDEAPGLVPSNDGDRS